MIGLQTQMDNNMLRYIYFVMPFRIMDNLATINK